MLKNIFNNIFLQYYVIIKPIQPMFNQIDNIFNSLFKF